MAKLKTYAVTVTVPVTRTYFVTARKPNGALEKLQTEQGWSEATAYEEPDNWTPMTYPKDAAVVSIKEVD